MSFKSWLGLWQFVALVSLLPRVPLRFPCPEINRRMRATEAKWPAGKTEGRKQYIARQRRTALGLPEPFVNRSIANMHVRCRLLHEARGGHFEEGGKRCR